MESIEQYPACRICYEEDVLPNLLSPCFCKGSMGHIHKNCIEKWFKQTGIARCEICNFEFTTVTVKKYNVFKSMWIWISHRNTAIKFWKDFIYYLLLFVATFAMFGLIFNVIDTIDLQFIINHQNTAGCLVSFGITISSAIIIAFICGTLRFYRHQVVPLYRFWQTSVEIHLKF